MDVLEPLAIHDWHAPVAPVVRQQAVAALESGMVLFLPHLPFRLEEGELALLSPSCGDGKAKNISFDPASGQVQGTSLTGTERERLTGMLRRYAEVSRALIASLAPEYAGQLEQARTSYRPVEAMGRNSSPRHDDRRLHVDAFPSRPMRGKRILRVFSNVNPDARARVWEVGEPFETFIARFLPRVARPRPALAGLQALLGITRGRRSAYDHVMLQLHDLAKLDEAYQAGAPKTRIEFPAGTSWIVYTDQVLHAALSGQFALEQTFHLPFDAMHTPARSPLRVLEARYGRTLL